MTDEERNVESNIPTETETPVEVEPTTEVAAEEVGTSEGEGADAPEIGRAHV